MHCVYSRMQYIIGIPESNQIMVAQKKEKRQTQNLHITISSLTLVC